MLELASLAYCQAHGVYAAHLPRAHADSDILLCEDDGIGFDMLHEPPGEIKSTELSFARRAVGDTFPVPRIGTQRVRRLQEQSPTNRFELQAVIISSCWHLHQAQILL